MCRLVFLSWFQFVQCLCILCLFYLTVLIACMIFFYYNVCDCHAFIKGNLLTYFMYDRYELDEFCAAVYLTADWVYGCG